MYRSCYNITKEISRKFTAFKMHIMTQLISHDISQLQIVAI